ncbi:kinase-like domain-containing protein [Scenedesmus sp. NREL 46B-D3]|nr:kinase-like domain-containing protein [Scenedesmus sp. NREL 46B-D3]
MEKSRKNGGGSGELRKRSYGKLAEANPFSWSGGSSSCSAGITAGIALGSLTDPGTLTPMGKLASRPVLITSTSKHLLPDAVFISGAATPTWLGSASLAGLSDVKQPAAGATPNNSAAGGSGAAVPAASSGSSGIGGITQGDHKLAGSSMHKTAAAGFRHGLAAAIAKLTISIDSSGGNDSSSVSSDPRWQALEYKHEHGYLPSPCVVPMFAGSSSAAAAPAPSAAAAAVSAAAAVYTPLIASSSFKHPRAALHSYPVSAAASHCRSGSNRSSSRQQKKLYEGYASTICKAYDRVSGSTVALKMYHMNKLNSISSHQVAREVRLHIGLNHENIILLYAAFQEAGHVVMVQEFAGGGDLWSFIDANSGRLTERDVKPENVLFSSSMVLKVADFGLAVNLREERAVTRVAPAWGQQGRHDLFYSQAVDAWAVGVLSYELLTGRAPFSAAGASDSATEAAIHCSVPAFLSRILAPFVIG